LWVGFNDAAGRLQAVFLPVAGGGRAPGPRRGSCAGRACGLGTSHLRRRRRRCCWCWRRGSGTAARQHPCHKGGEQPLQRAAWAAQAKGL